MSTQSTIIEGDGWFINRDLLSDELFLYDETQDVEIELTTEIVAAIAGLKK